MDPQTFSNPLAYEAANFVGDFYNVPDLPRTHVPKIVDKVENFLKNRPITLLLKQMLHRLAVLKEDPGNLEAYKCMISTSQGPFTEVNTEWKYMEYMKKTHNYIPPQEILIDEKDKSSGTKAGIITKKKTISVQFIPLRNVLKQFFELPGIFDSTKQYLEKLEKEKTVVTNFVQGEFWKIQKKLFADRLVLPLLLYQDDFETNNPLGSHRGLGKIGAVYIVIPCLPPGIQSKPENIFLLTLYKSLDQKYVPLDRIFSPAIQELQFLEREGISIATSSGVVNICFSLAGVIGDNLAIHTILGFSKSFNANYPCRFL